MMLKRAFYLLFSLFVAVGGICSATDVDQTSIVLRPGFNVVSTPATVSGISFSNGGANITAFTMSGGKWQQAIMASNDVSSVMRPLEGFLFNNSSSSPVTMTLQYDKSANYSNLMHSKSLDAGWNLLGITTEDDPFANIALANATMVVDFTKNEYRNSVLTGESFSLNPTIFQLGKSYGVFINQDKGIYGGVNDYAILDECAESPYYDECREYRSRRCGGDNSYSSEIVDAYNWAYSKGIITSYFSQFCVYEGMTNLEMAEILVKYAEIVLGRTPDTQASCNYSDLGSLNNEEIGYITEACQLGIMGQDTITFRPYDIITRAEFGTALSRLLWGSTYEGGTPYYANHLNALKTAGIMTQISNAESTIEVKGYVILMLQRMAGEIEEDEDCEDESVQIACTLGSDECPMQCREVGDSGLIKLSNVNLGMVKSLINSTDVKIAEGYIGTTESIVIDNFSILGNNSSSVLSGIKITIGGNTYTGTILNNNEFKFSNVEISGSTNMQKFEIYVDIINDLGLVGSGINFTSINANIFNNAKYKDSQEDVNISDIIGTIIPSKLNIVSAKGNLENNLTKDVEFIQSQTSRKVVFDGTYTAKNADVYLNSASINGTNIDIGTYMIFYLSIDGEEVADIYGLGNEETFSEVLVGAGESVSVKVEAEVGAYGPIGTYDDFYLILKGEDANGNSMGNVSDRLVTMKIKEGGLVNITTTDRNNALLKSNTYQTLAIFTLKPSNSIDDLVLDNITFTITGSNELGSEDLSVWFDGSEEDAYSEIQTTTGNTITYLPGIVGSDEIVVIVDINREYTGIVELTVTNVNGKSQIKTFNKRYEEALVYVESQEDLDGSTKFYLAVETADFDTIVSNVKFYAGNDCLYAGNQEVVNGDDIEIVNSWNGGAAKMIDKIEYTVKVYGGNDQTVVIDKATYNDYFKVGSTYAKVFKVD